MNLAYEGVDHFLRLFKVGNNAVLQWALGNDVARGPTNHLLGLLTDCLDLVAPFRRVVNGDHGRFVNNDPPAFHMNQGIGCAQVNANIE